ncbi:hypothetical protein KI688_003113 [Linnemannia hyalina]|uniref:Uncharacterized protein n=1 Tax=Linnemannia hyalina TaxID=64524 RepID=A0A9P7XQJ1_9FUNG|nr:hypothetical protein KI688_003113 [Linnemannia hyalina]
MNYGQGYPPQQGGYNNGGGNSGYPANNGGYDSSAYPPQQQQHDGYNNSGGYDPNSGGYDPNSGAGGGYDPNNAYNSNYNSVSAPPYSAYPPSANMLSGGGNAIGGGGGYPGASPAFNPMHLNSNNSVASSHAGGGMNNYSSHGTVNLGNGGSGYDNSGYVNTNNNNGYDNNGSNGNYGNNNGNFGNNNNNNNSNSSNSNSNSGNYSSPPANQSYQAGQLNYQGTVYNPNAASNMQNNNSNNSGSPISQGQPLNPDQAKAPQPEGEYPVVMAIDFGTTFSGVAYALKADGEVHDMTKWPRHLAQYPKTPTLSLYKKDSTKILDWGHAARLAMLKPSAKDFCLLRKFKLQLDESLHNAPLENGISALDAVTHYLKKLHGHVMMELMKGFIKNYEPNQFQYCLTVPAMWSDGAKNTMRRAAIGAGLIQEGDPPNRLILISEPEAAAMYCERMVDRFSLKHGDRFMICDAGGGTVDLIVFEVNEPPGQARHLREVTRGHGASCGSVFLDANMERLLERKFKRYRRGIKACGWASLMDTFVDMVKPMFNGQEDVLMQIPQATGLEDLNDHEIGLEDGVLCVSVEEMKAEVFEPVISDVLDLIQKQLHQSQSCSAIFMVGGFGSSRYLEERVRQEFGHLVGLVAVPQRPELAVVRGAVYAGLNTKTINMRVARRWYGVDANMPFEEGVDPESKKIISHDGHVRCKERFSVYVRPGQQIGVDECVSKEYVTWSYPKGLDSPLYVCNSPNQPKYITDPGVQKIADFHIPMPEIPGAQPRTRVVFKLNLYFGLTEVRAEAVINGNTYTTICSFGGGAGNR